jgi:hypothetical protein
MYILSNLNNINIEALRSLFQWICLGLLVFFIVYSSVHVTLYDDAKKKINKNHDSFRSIHASWGISKVRFGLPIPILSKAENEEIKKFKISYNKIILGFWITVILTIIAFNV